MMDPRPTRWWAEYAMLPSGVARGVRLQVRDGRFAAVEAGVAPADAARLPGVVLPGMANAHSHAFHRALRGRTHASGGTFWTWREAMYALAERLDPEGYLRLARAAYAEMALTGYTAVGEFHYLRNAVGGARYDDPQAMAAALVQAARDAGVRLTLLDACYLRGGLDQQGHQPLSPVQRRFGRDNVEDWAVDHAGLAHLAGERVRIGAAVHSIRAVPREAVPVVVDAAGGAPLHVHLSEQPSENQACQAFYSATPAAVLAECGALGRRTTVVHATHLQPADIALLGASATTACLCPTTERDLADGIGPARALADAGSPLAVGSDQHAVVDPFEEARGIEMGERLIALRRGRFAPSELLRALTCHASIGWYDAGSLAPGARADLVSVRLDTPRTAGSAPDQVLLSATAADVDTVMIDGELVVRDGVHRLGDVGRLLHESIAPLWARG